MSRLDAIVPFYSISDKSILQLIETRLEKRVIDKQITPDEKVKIQKHLEVHLDGEKLWDVRELNQVIDAAII